MKYNILMNIEDKNTQAVEATALSNDTADICIYAGSWQQAQALLDQAQDVAAEACRNWKPEEATAQDQKHYYTISRSMEEMQEAAAAYEDSPRGQRFAKSVENAIEFTFKHSNGGLHVTQLNYLVNKHYNSLLNGSMDLTALAYRRGYMDGKATAKK